MARAHVARSVVGVLHPLSPLRGARGPGRRPPVRQHEPMARSVGRTLHGGTCLMSRRTWPALAIAFLLGTADARDGGLSADERKVVAHVDAHRDEAVALLENVINIPSASRNLVGVRAVGKVFDAEF